MGWWLVSSHNLAHRVLNPQQYRPQGDSNSGCSSHSWKSVGLPKSMKLPFLFYGHQYGTSTTNYRWGVNSSNVDLFITSREIVKPASPTPYHLRTYNLSIIDQLFVDCYTPLILFFPNDTKSTAHVTKHLKKSLSETLTRFYPFAGEVVDDLHIMCSDKGVNFIEARVNQSLKEFLRQPDDGKVRQLVPKSPRTGETSMGNYITGVQVNIFKCGGIALSSSVTHKLFDGHTYFLFMKAWAAATRGSPQKVLPSFVASKVFPNNPNLNYSWPSKFMNTESVSTKRFVFDPMAIATLKDKAFKYTSKRGPTRVEATTALIWKTAAKASLAIKPFINSQSPHALLSYVNLRARASPPLPYESIGNLICTTTGICFPGRQLDLAKLMDEVRASIAKINSDHIDSFKGEKGHDIYNGLLNRLQDLMDITEEGERCLSVTSLMNNGVYNIDFGWGTPIWFYAMNAGFTRIVALNDTLKRGGVEATVTLSSNEMEIFESDTELLSYATVNSSPLEFLTD